MSWIEKCYETYETCLDEVGIQKYQSEDSKRALVPLLPVAHTTQQVNIEVELDRSGNFENAHLLTNKSDQTTIIPCTEESSARTSGVVPHPLVDKLQYIAADYESFGGSKKAAWPQYHEQLSAWCASPYGHELVRVVLQYLEKGCLIADLVKKRILFMDEHGKLPTKWTGAKDAKPEILDTLTGGDQTESFVRFRVGNVDLSRDSSVRESFIRYYETCQNRVDVCTVQGRRMAVSALSPYKIRNPGDRAKLISGNDSTNFTYRGRFANTDQALSIGYETTQKAHSALRWLISRQGCNTGDQTVLVWSTDKNFRMNLIADSVSFCSDSDLTSQAAFLGQTKTSPSTEKEFAKRFNDAVRGYGKQLTENTAAMVMILDSATPGRMSIRYYREIQGSQLLANVNDWHQTFVWRMEYRSIPDSTAVPGKKQKYKNITFVGAPSPIDIAKAAYGEGVDTKLVQQTIERLVPCIAEKKCFPRDLMLSAVHRATAGISLEPWEYRKTCSIACALIRGYYHRNKKEDFPMGVDENIQDRSYLFGRILACAEQIERRAQSQSDDKRPTNAERLRVVFVQRPAKTTELLQERLTPYLNRIHANGIAYNSRYELMLNLLDRLGTEGYTNKPLSELYLLGYASQMMDFRRENVAYNENSENAEITE